MVNIEGASSCRYFPRYSKNHFVTAGATDINDSINRENRSRFVSNLVKTVWKSVLLSVGPYYICCHPNRGVYVAFRLLSHSFCASLVSTNSWAFLLTHPAHQIVARLHGLHLELLLKFVNAAINERLKRVFLRPRTANQLEILIEKHRQDK